MWGPKQEKVRKNNNMSLAFALDFQHAGITMIFHLQGLTSRGFGNVPNLQILECSGLALDSKEDLLSMTIFTSQRGNDVTLVSVNLRKGECSIAENVFSLCKLDNANSRMTSLQTLIANPAEGKPREYRCNATGYEAPGRVHTKTWSLTVFTISESL